MDSRKQGRADFFRPSGPSGIAWTLGMGALLILVGCQEAEVREMPQITSLPTVRVKSDSSQVSSAKPITLAKAETEGSGGNRQTSHTQEGANIIAAMHQVDTQANPPRQPEVLPLPEKLEEPEPSPTQVEIPADALGMTLTAALAQGLADNPDLVTLRAQLPVNQAMIGVAKTPIWNPFVQAQYLPTGSPRVPNAPGQPASGAGQSNYYVWAMQRFELAHQRRYRTQSARAALNQVQWNIMQAELLYVAQSSRLYFAALYQKELYDLAAAARISTNICWTCRNGVIRPTWRLLRM